MKNVLTSSEFHGWQTPPSFLELVRKVAPIALDPCTVHANPAQARRYITTDEPEAMFITELGGVKHYCGPFGWAAKDGLDAGWLPWTDGHGLAFVNPPYGRALADWAHKCVHEAAAGVQQVILVPCRPDTAWYAILASLASMRLEWRGRITFVDPRAPAGMQWDVKRATFVKATPSAFPCAVFYFAGADGATKRFMDAFDGKGRFCQDIRRAA